MSTEISNKLKEVLEASGMNQVAFSEKFGINRTTLNKYLSGDIGKMGLDKVEAICDAYNLNPSWFMGFRDAEKYLPKNESEKKKVPVLGYIAAGVPILAQEEILDYEFVRKEYNIDFFLKVEGNSMKDARILDGDLVGVRQQSEVENGEIAVVLVDGENATLKRFFKEKDFIILKPANHDFKDLIFTRSQAKDIKILGKAVYFRSEVK